VGRLVVVSVVCVCVFVWCEVVRGKVGCRQCGVVWCGVR